MRRSAARALCGLLLRAVGVRTFARGILPPGGALLIANHIGWVDILAAYAHLGCTFVAKQEVARWPVVGWWARRAGVVFVDRTRKRDLLRTIPIVTEALQAGRRVLLFAEGTTGDGRTLLPFKSAMVEAAVRARVQVVPIAIAAEADDADPRAMCWLGTETLLENLPRLLALSGAAVTVTIGTPLRAGACRKLLTYRARAAISELVTWPAVCSRVAHASAAVETSTAAVDIAGNAGGMPLSA